MSWNMKTLATQPSILGPITTYQAVELLKESLHSSLSSQEGCLSRGGSGSPAEPVGHISWSQCSSGAYRQYRVPLAQQEGQSDG